MNSIDLDIMKGMVSILNQASEAYYNTGHPIMTDEQFDSRLEDLRQFEKETGFVLANSPTHNVGAKVLTELKEVMHNHLMLSLEKCHTVEELIKFANNKELVASIKLDGLTVSLTYEDGILTCAETRGDGIRGSDIIEHVKQFKNIPLKINKKGTYIIDGEAIITDEDFSEVNKNGDYKNSRNLAAGTLSVLDTSLVAKRKLRFIAWDVIDVESNNISNSLKDNLAEARTLGFDVVPNWSVVNLDPKKLQGTIDYIFDYASGEGLPCDGIVFKFDDIEYGYSLGMTSHHFKNGIAYKQKNNEIETKLIGIDWTLGKSGVITPTAIFDAVEIYGTICERASLHNISIMKELLGYEPYIGQRIVVTKSNMIIPQVVSADKSYSGIQDLILDIPTKCPICCGETKIKKENDSEVLVCTNDNCKGKLLGKLTHFVSKNAMNIDGLSEATLEKFIELGWLTCFDDIFRLKDYSAEMMNLDGFSEKSVKKLLNSIEKSRNTTLDRFIYSLSIPLIGKSASKDIAKACANGDFNQFRMIMDLEDEYAFIGLNGFGKEMNKSLRSWWYYNKDMFYRISRYLTFEVSQATSNNSNLSGLNFVITGSLNHFANRDEAKDKIEAAGGKVSGSVSAKTSYLINNDVASTSGKNKKAKELGVKIITENELVEMLNS